MKTVTNSFSIVRLDSIIEMAWEYKTGFDAIRNQFNLSEHDVKSLMKKELKFSSYKLWQTRVENCKIKHLHKRIYGIERFKCSMQRLISNIIIAKRI